MGMMRCIEAQPAESDGVRLLRFEVGKRAMEKTDAARAGKSTTGQVDDGANGPIRACRGCCLLVLLRLL